MYLKESPCRTCSKQKTKKFFKNDIEFGCLRTCEKMKKIQSILQEEGGSFSDFDTFNDITEINIPSTRK